MDTTRQSQSGPKPADKGDSTTATRDRDQDRNTPNDRATWVERPDWRGAGVVSENHTD